MSNTRSKKADGRMKKQQREAAAKRMAAARGLFLNMQSQPRKVRRELARRLMRRTDLKEMAKQRGMKLKDLVKEIIN